MLRRKKVIWISLAVLLVVAIVVYLMLNAVLDSLSRQAMGRLVAEAKQQGLEVLRLSFDAVWLSGFLSTAWSDMRADVKLQADEANEAGRVWQLQADRVLVDWDFGGKTSLDVSGITLVGSSRGRELSNRRIELDRVTAVFLLELFNPEAALEKLMPEFARLIKDGTIGLPLEVEGKLLFSLRDRPIELHLQVEQRGDDGTIVLNRDDVAALSSLFEEKLTDAEVDVIASFPRRAPRLLEIKDDAESTSASANQADAEVPQDAYRHILWSYLLTQGYGAAFAERVGDAHETGDTGNTPAERQMDLHNNAIGRKYAEEGTPRTELLERLMSDTEVRQTP